MASKLEIFNDALAHLGERKLASLSEAREPRRRLDDQWDRGLRYCLEQGLWNFAMRSVQIDHSAQFTPAFGMRFAFVRPADWIRTALISDNENMEPPLLRYHDERDLIYADCDPIFVQYVSDDPTYGLDLSLWPETFAEYVAVHLARKICQGMTSSESRHAELVKLEKKMRVDARSKDAMNQAVGFPPQGTWARSRGRTDLRRSRWDGTTI
jgi:hypothetical protein